MSNRMEWIPFKTNKARQSCVRRFCQKGGVPFQSQDLWFDISDAVEEDGTRVARIENGDRKPCAVVHIYPPSATLQTFEYGSTCARNKRMDRGGDTRKMLIAVREYLKQQGVSIMVFTDASTYTCFDKTRVSLRMSYLLEHGKTWYDAVLGCEPTDVRQKQLYATAKQKALSMTWNEARTHLPPSSELLELFPPQPGLLCDFVRHLRTSELCSVYQEYLYSLMLCISPVTFEGVVFETKW